MRRKEFILAIIGYVSMSVKLERRELKELAADLQNNLPSNKRLKEEDYMSRVYVENFLEGNYQVRVYTKVAEAIKKLLK
jgi:hypothetical protein